MNFTNNVKEIAIEAGNRILEIYNSPDFGVEIKDDKSPLTKADKAANDYIVEQLKKEYPEFGILSEESKSTNVRFQKKYVWIVDPLDGTTNFAHGFPHFCISLALFENNQPLLGIVFDPCKKEMFSAIKGQGTHINSSPCYVSKTTSLEYSLLATGFPYKVQELKHNNLAEFCAFRLRAQGVRRAGAAGWDSTGHRAAERPAMDAAGCRVRT